METIITNKVPNFLITYKSKTRLEKRNLIRAYCNVFECSEQKFHWKRANNTWIKIEREWWAKTLNISEEILFPNN